MATEAHHWRHHHVGCHLADTEWAELERVRQALHLPVRVLLMIGVRHAWKAFVREQRREQWRRRNASSSEDC